MMGFTDWMMKRMMSGMTKEEKQEMMGKMMDEFFVDFTREDMMEMRATMMLQMMESMMGDGETPCPMGKLFKAGEANEQDFHGICAKMMEGVDFEKMMGQFSGSAEAFPCCTPTGDETAEEA